MSSTPTDPDFDTPSEHDPGTPDNKVPQKRLHGRYARRTGKTIGDCPYAAGDARVQWMLGYEDVRLERFYA